MGRALHVCKIFSSSSSMHLHKDLWGDWMGDRGGCFSIAIYRQLHSFVHRWRRFVSIQQFWVLSYYKFVHLRSWTSQLLCSCLAVIILCGLTGRSSIQMALEGVNSKLLRLSSESNLHWGIVCRHSFRLTTAQAGTGRCFYPCGLNVSTDLYYPLH